MVLSLKYPNDIESRTHFDISAFEYELPRINERTLTGTSANTNSSNTSPNAATSLSEAVTAKRTNALFTAKLYIPSGFGDSTSSEWAEEGVVLRGSSNEIKGIGSNPLQKLFDVGASDVTEAFRQTLQGAINKGLTALSPIVANTLSARAGAILAMSNAKIFKGSSGRVLSFVINFAPKNSSEGKMMLRLIDAFRAASIAELIVGGNTVFAYKFPPLFDIRIIKGSASGQTIRTGTFFEYKTMVLNSFDVRFEGDGELYTYFTDDIPTGAAMTLGFESIFPAFTTSEVKVANVNDDTQFIIDQGGT